MFYFYPWGEKDYSKVLSYQKNLEKINSNDGISQIYAQKFLPHHLLNDIKMIRNFQPVLFCHDQEPLFFDFYQDDGLAMEKYFSNVLKKYPYPVSQQNLRSCHPWSWYERWILLHTEKNSTELGKYEQTGRYLGAFWWSHAIISRDWYRYARYDKSLDSNSDRQKLFLVYARDFSGTRQYRQTFIESISDLTDHCQIGSFNSKKAKSDSSATYQSDDFVFTGISIVLETLFEDSRIYLTEKILRPIACGHPFILAAGPSSLEFLRSYGFETFRPWIDESYDTETNHARRLEMITEEMRRISSLPDTDKKRLLESCYQIAQRNKERFFSDSFFNYVVDELRTNVKNAYEQVKDRYSSDFHWNTRKWRKKQGIDTRTESRNIIVPFIRRCRLDRRSLEQYQGHQHSLDDKSSTDGNDV
jgi:hypothetical protein